MKGSIKITYYFIRIFFGHYDFKNVLVMTASLINPREEFTNFTLNKAVILGGLW